MTHDIPVFRFKRSVGWFAAFALSTLFWVVTVGTVTIVLQSKNAAHHRMALAAQSGASQRIKAGDAKSAND